MKNKIDKNKIDKYYSSLLTTVKSPVKMKNLKIIYKILYEKFENSDNDFSIASIGRESEKRNGISTQAIRNHQGKDYRLLIDYFTNNIKINLQNFDLINNDISDYIEDNSIKAHVNLLIAENKSLKNQLNILKSNMSNNFQLNYDIENKNSVLLNIEIESIKKFLFDLKENRLSIKITDNMGLKDQDDMLIANAGFVDGLSKLVDD